VCSSDLQIISLVRNEVRVPPYSAGSLREGDVVLIEADPASMAQALDSLGLEFGESKDHAQKDEEYDDESDTNSNPQEGLNAASLGDRREEHHDGGVNVGVADDDTDEPEQEDPEKEQEKKIEETTKASDVELMELVILPGSPLLGRSARDLDLRKRYGITVLAISRQGARIHSRVRHTSLRDGDVLLMQGPSDLITDFASDTGCAPLAPRPLRSPNRRNMLTAAGIMVFSIALTATGILPAAISFLLGVVLLMVLRVLPLRKMYNSVDWSVIVLLGALLPVAQAMEETGTAQLIAVFLLENVAQGNAIWALVVVLAVTLTMSDVINNAATAAIMCPIAIGTAQQLGVNPDPYLMAVAI